MGDNISPIAHVIQLSVAPVFLLSGIGAILAFFLGLLWFLREIFVATKSLRIASRKVHGRLAK